MILTKYKGYLNSKKEDGFTIIEVLVAMTIMSILGITMWMGFSAAVSLIHTVPESSRLIQEIIALDSILREYISRVRVPFWLPELDYYIDTTSALFPYYEGIETKFLQIEYYDNEIYLKTFEEESDEEPETIYHTGPFTYVNFSEVSEKKLGLLGLEITLKHEHERIEEFTIFARLGGYAFEAP